MNATLTTVTATYAAVLAVLALAAAVRPPRRSAYLTSGTVVLQGLLMIGAGTSGWSWLHGHRPAEAGTHLGYLGCSVVLLPLLVWRPRDAAEPRWDHAVLVVAATALVVITLRAAATWSA